MEKNALWKWLILALMVCASLALVYPPSKKVTLGLDLRGGTSFVLEIDTQTLEKDMRAQQDGLTDEEIATRIKEMAQQGREQALEVIRNRVDGLGISEPVIYSASYRDQERIIVQLPGIDEEKREQARRSIQDAAFLEFRLVAEKSADWGKDLLDAGKAPFGFKVGEGGEHYVRDRSAVPDEKMDQAAREQIRRFEPHAGCEFMLERDLDPVGREIYRPYYVEVRRQLTGDALKSAAVDYNPMTHQPNVEIEFDSKGAKKFASVTRSYAPRGVKNPNSDLGRQLAIVLDGTLYSAPVIREEIPSGKAEISGRFKVPEAMRLANVLRSGSLPVPVKVVQTSTVDPTLGRDSIRSGTRAALWSIIVVMLFMFMYYRYAGFVADIALMTEALLFPLAMVVAGGFLGLFTSSTASGGSQFGLPTLTMPGIAGIILSVGMAVDANVIIYERIREEMRAGKTIGAAIGAGYERAFSAIFDSNLTTIITAVILFILGTGPIRGYAVTLTAGIIISMIVVLIYTRLFFEVMVRKFNLKSLHMTQLIKPTSIDFLRLKFPAIIVSLVIILGTGAAFFYEGYQKNMGVDFMGGTSLLLSFDQKVPVEQVRDALQGAKIDATIQYQREMGEIGSAKEFLDVRVGENDDEAAKQVLSTAFTEAGFKILKEDQVRGQVGEELRRKAIWAFIWAWVGMIVYLSFRFEFSFAVGTIVALVHDVLVTAGVFCLLGRQINLPVVAALLTIVGYSANDTIVIFDRIREDLKLYKGKSYKDICNLSINQTLSRTILTTVTTLLSVLVLLLFGGGVIFDFALTLVIGLIAGTYSTVFIATPVTLAWHREKPKAE